MDRLVHQVQSTQPHFLRVKLNRNVGNHRPIVRRRNAFNSKAAVGFHGVVADRHTNIDAAIDAAQLQTRSIGPKPKGISRTIDANMPCEDRASNRENERFSTLAFTTSIVARSTVVVAIWTI